MDLQFPTKPAPPDSYTQKRWEASSLRRRMLLGSWFEDLEEELSRHIPSDRRAAWGVPDLSTNVFQSVCVALSALYHDPPAGGSGGASPGAADGLLGRGGLVEKGGLWPIMQRVQLFTIGLREMFLNVSFNPETNGLLYRPVTPDMIWAESPAADPMNPNILMELRIRKHEELKELTWAWDVYDIRDPSNPIMAVKEADMDGGFGVDLSDMFLDGDRSGLNYPFRDSDGKPRIPYSIFHASLGNSHLFDPFDGTELVSGSLTAAVSCTYLLHLIRDCSHPQRYVMGANLAGAGIYDMDGGARRAAIASDPASILVFSPSEDMAGLGSPLLGQFAAGGKPLEMMECLTLFERKLAQGAGISPASVQKISGDPRSGYAIAMSRTDQREAQRKFAPAMRFGDINTMEISAIVANRYLGTNYPEKGYKIEYSAIPLSKEESEAIRKDVMEKLTAGLISHVEAIRTI